MVMGKIQNEEFRPKNGVESISKMMENKKLECYGHVLRMNMGRKIFETKPHWKTR